MKEIKQQKAITLIALIITIIILLILAIVTIGSMKNSNIITYAQNASTDYSTKKDEEKGIISGYETLIENNLYNGSKVTYIVEGVPVPTGFKHIEETKKDTGLVIENETEGSQFVWVPVPEISEFARPQTEGSKDYEGVLYDFSGTTVTEENDYGIETLGRREPAVVTDYDTVTNLEDSGVTTDLTGDKLIDGNDFKYQLQKEFNSMVASVSKYGGFYVGRYEVSKNRRKSSIKSRWNKYKISHSI